MVEWLVHHGATLSMYSCNRYSSLAKEKVISFVIFALCFVVSNKLQALTSDVTLKILTLL